LEKNINTLIGDVILG